MKEAAAIIFLLWNALLDWKYRRISLSATGIFAAGGMIWALAAGKTLGNLFGGMLPAIMLGGLSILTKGSVGLGDCLVLAAVGTVLEPQQILSVIGISLFLAAVWAVVLLTVFRKGKHAEFPFVPFLLLGYIGGLFLW